MKNPAEKKIHEIWETQEIRFLVLFSLVIQALLTFVSPLRKRCSQSYIQIFIWMLYLLADVVAVYTIGLISNNKGHHYEQSLELLALWAAFLLLHLGGPDTITALALEDNELWRRHALQLATQVSVTVLVFSRSFQYHNRNRLWVPTVLMFADGFIKYFERTCALFFASRDIFRESIMREAETGPNYARLMEEYYSATSANLPARFQEDDVKGKKAQQHDEQHDSKPNQHSTNKGDEDSSVHLGRRRFSPSSSEQKVQEAHYYYQLYKPLLAEGFLSLKDRQDSRDFFIDQCDDKVAFEIIQIELNLIYDAFYTKSFLLHKRRAAARVLCFVFVVVSLVLFCLKWDYKNQKTDGIVTFLLFCGAIALDLSAATMFLLSDWWIILSNDKKRSRSSSLYWEIAKFLFRLSKEPRKWLLSIKECCKHKLYQQKRWSHSISQYSLLKYCFRSRFCLFKDNKCKFCNPFNLKCARDLIIRFLYVKTKKVDESKEIHDNLMSFIRKEIWDKAKQASDIEVAKKVFSARGNLVLEDDYYIASACLRPWTEDLDYDESLMIWHLATDICYWKTTIDDNRDDNRQNENKYRGYSKELSDYMLYLVIWQQSLLSTVVGMSETRFHDTCKEAKKFNDNEEIRISWWRDLWSRAISCCSSCCCGSPSNQIDIEEKEFLKSFSKKVVQVKAVVKPMVAKGDKSKSVLFDACRLAMQLEMFGENQWEITSKVWLELLCYAAVRCSPRYHIAQLSKGGELITLVWLYMAHLGLGERFLKNQGFGSTKLVIEK